MSAHPRIIGYLQRALSHELLAVQQCILQAATATSLGLAALADQLRSDAHDELAHAEAFAAQLLRCGAGLHASQPHAPRVGRTHKEILHFGLATEVEAVRLYSEAATFCARIGDHDNHALFSRIGEDERQHRQSIERVLQALEGGR